MGVENIFYGEVFAGGAWRNLNPLIKRKDGGAGIMPLYWGQSRLCGLVDDLRGYALYSGVPEDACDEVKSHFSSLDAVVESWGSGTTWREYYRECVFVVDYQAAFAGRLTKDRPFRQQGYVLRDLIPAFECGEIGEIESWITAREYGELPDDERREFAYFEWNNAFDEYGMRAEISKRVDVLYDWLLESAWSSDSELSHRDFDAGTPRIRIIVEQSW